MPNRDGTGPSGMGPKTGRGMGPCGGNARQDQPAGSSRGGFWSNFFNIGRGRGRGHRRWFKATGLPFWARSNAPNQTEED